LKILKTFFVKTKTKSLGLKTKTLLFVLEAPRDRDFGLEDYITGMSHAARCIPPEICGIYFPKTIVQQYTT